MPSIPLLVSVPEAKGCFPKGPRSKPPHQLPLSTTPLASTSKVASTIPPMGRQRKPVPVNDSSFLISPSNSITSNPATVIPAGGGRAPSQCVIVKLNRFCLKVPPPVISNSTPSPMLAPRAAPKLTGSERLASTVPSSSSYSSRPVRSRSRLAFMSPSSLAPKPSLSTPSAPRSPLAPKPTVKARRGDLTSFKYVSSTTSSKWSMAFSTAVRRGVKEPS